MVGFFLDVKIRHFHTHQYSPQRRIGLSGFQTMETMSKLEEHRENWAVEQLISPRHKKVISVKKTNVALENKTPLGLVFVQGVKYALQVSSIQPPVLYSL